MRIAIVGSTGLVGTEMLKVVDERIPNVSEIIPVASEKSIGKVITFRGKNVPVVGLKHGVLAKPNIALFSAGSSVSKEWAPLFAEAGAFVIDNSSFWRQHDTIPLIVPEVNGHILKADHKIIANPNCSTIQLVVGIAPLHKRYGIRRIVISTYQSVSGTGVKAVSQLYAERAGEKTEMAYPHPIDLNCIPHGGTFLESGYTTEEQKLIDETRKILNDSSIMISPTVVRVPVVGGHSESVNIEFESEFDMDEVFSLLRDAKGITIQDDPSHNVYPMPLYSKGKDDVFIGRIRRDPSQPRSLNLWIVSDNLRKGAATNAVQIAELIIERGWVGK
ncbi:MAG: aspartate-semialdehyde dehydrogenase [Tenuifilaceae bacterium]|jgi:aspartate-semialdehyde dehydrogenase|nr:aspartate-semialdehyde dehydrogenase [Bacteroidales bacterium]MDI9515941.1 aspartate-semialdehyde dehydrogenase [Bacteroidota bacterium]NLH57640.1 aspartate-semialdehyde dehydrogenase [Rikenellaceae bacterium]OQC64242.1 MAG: Aspartate-semialdehyde dehydrogenase [Bacteroidetes bacterium ADurb.Bin008]HNV80829.1 aspartate-semialdehyde dehydrogenase [Tenuifilaceae bacterium]